jgi:hypothetical protein
MFDAILAPVDQRMAGLHGSIAVHAVSCEWSGRALRKQNWKGMAVSQKKRKRVVAKMHREPAQSMLVAA